MSRGLAGAIRLCGLGPRPPHETSLETLEALQGCRVVFTDIKDRKLLAWLKSWCRELKTTATASAVVAEAKRAEGPVGVAVWGHPLLTSPFCRRVLAQASASSVRADFLAAVSPVSSALASQGDFFGDDFGLGGLNVYEAGTLLSRKSPPDPAIPLVVFSRAGDRVPWSRVLRRLPKGAGRKRVRCAGAEMLLSAAKR